MWHVVVASIPAKTASPPRTHRHRQRRLWMSVSESLKSLQIRDVSLSVLNRSLRGSPRDADCRHLTATLTGYGLAIAHADAAEVAPEVARPPSWKDSTTR